MVVVLPSSKSLDLNWNYGSILGMILFFQIFTGFLLSFFYSNDRLLAFDSVQYIIYDVNYGWLYRVFHFNGASLFFVFLYLHFFKGLFNRRYRLSLVWLRGVFIIFFVILEAFMGYVLVWAQISFWACVVITRLLSVVPFFGGDLVLWVWGGFTVSGATLKLFFAVHFLLPWFIFVLVVFHLIMLHVTGRTSVLSGFGDYDKIGFFPYYWLKDSYNLVVWLFFFVFVFSCPFVLGDPEIFLLANYLMSPVHIVPEWYFLFAYAILRAFPNKFLGVVMLVFSIFVFVIFVFINSYVSVFDVLVDFFVWFFLFVVLLLSWLGQCPVEWPYVFFSVFYSLVYFILIFMVFFQGLFFKFLYFYTFSIIVIWSIKVW